MVQTKPTIVELDMDKLEEILPRPCRSRPPPRKRRPARRRIWRLPRNSTLRTTPRHRAKHPKGTRGTAATGPRRILAPRKSRCVKILELMGEQGRQSAWKDTDDDTAEDSAEAPAEKCAEGSAKEPGPERTGMFTTGIVATGDGHKIALFISGRRHAGENLEDVLRRRAAELPPPIQMCDALSRNLPDKLKTIVANCLAHGRRQFVDRVDLFPEECRHVLEALAVVYHNDAIARRRKLSPQERLLFHQAESGPTMEELHVWLVRQFDERRVEPNSGLGKAISYLRRHWEKLTLFLRVPGAPLDNNVCERALKKAQAD